jgi:hypothetical protein
VLGDPELVALLERAVQAQAIAGLELARDPRLVEPDGDDRAAVVVGARLDALAAAIAHRSQRDAAHGDLDRRLLADAQRGHRTHLAPVPVRVRKVLDQVPERRDPERRRPLPRRSRERQLRSQPTGMRQRPQRRGERGGQFERRAARESPYALRFAVDASKPAVDALI